MRLATGTKLGSYEMLSPLGAGGMGEVYLATDSKLDRKVAIKVLPETMTRDQERVARFEREAKLLASLNHPNIAAIYGFESVSDTDSSRAAGFSPRGSSSIEDASATASPRKLKHAARSLSFLLMENVAGETFGNHLKNGPVAVEDALDIAKQIAEALEAAHKKGVIHRDLISTLALLPVARRLVRGRIAARPWAGRVVLQRYRDVWGFQEPYLFSVRGGSENRFLGRMAPFDPLA